MTNVIAQRTEYLRSENGTDVYVLKTPTKDVVTCMMAFSGAGVYASYALQSVVSLFADILPSGTKKHDKNYILEKFESLGARVSVSHSGGYMLVTLVSRNIYFLEAFQLLLDVLINVSLSDIEFQSALSRIRNAYIHAEEDTRILAKIALHQSMYCKGHPHWKPTIQQLVKELGSITRESVLTFHKDTFSAIGSIVCVVGDVQPKKIIQSLRNSINSLPSTVSKNSTTLHVEKTNNPDYSEKIVSIKNKFNVDTYIGIPLALTRDHTDFQALQLGIGVLGSSSSSRLFTILRTQKNLTYGSYAQLDGFADGYPGFLSAQAIFPNDMYTVGKVALEEAVQVFIEKGVKSRELEERKEETVGKFKVNLSTTVGMCSALFSTVLSGKPISYIDEYPEQITTHTVRTVNTVIKKHINFSLSKTAASGAINKEGIPL